MQSSKPKTGEAPNATIWQSPRKRQRTENSNKKQSIAEKSMKYYKIHELSPGKVLCKCTLCPESAKPINVTNACNLGSHLKTTHSDLFNEKIADHIKEPLPVKRLRLLQNAVEIVGVNGRAFKFLTDSGYIAGIANKLEKLRKAGMGIDFSNKNLPEVKEHLKKMTEKVRTKITQQLKGRFVCIMVDICGKNNNRPVLGVSAQLIINSKIVIRSLGMIELHETHTGENLAKLLIEILTEFEIEKWQVLTITTDNGANVVKMVTDFNHIINDTTTDGEMNASNLQTSRQLLPEFNAVNNGTVYQRIQTELATPAETSEQALAILFHNQEVEDQMDIFQDTANSFLGSFEEAWNTTGVNCVAHTLQLAVRDALKVLHSDYFNVIELATRVCSFLRNQTTEIAMRAIGLVYNRPRMDCKTRWGSTCLMVSVFYFLDVHKIYGTNIAPLPCQKKIVCSD